MDRDRAGEPKRKGGATYWGVAGSGPLHAGGNESTGRTRGLPVSFFCLMDKTH